MANLKIVTGFCMRHYSVCLDCILFLGMPKLTSCISVFFLSHENMKQETIEIAMTTKLCFSLTMGGEKQPESHADQLLRKINKTNGGAKPGLAKLKPKPRWKK